MLNGRINPTQTHFIFGSSQGSSVVDYSFTPYEEHRFKDTKVLIMSELLDEFSLRQMLNPATTLSYHSLLTWPCELSFRTREENINDWKQVIMEETVIYEKEITDDFMEKKVDKLKETVINEKLQSQKKIDNIYNDMICIVKTKMDSKLGKLS